MPVWNSVSAIRMASFPVCEVGTLTVKPGFLMIAVALVLFGCTGDFQPSLDQLRAAEQSFDNQALLRGLEAIKAWHRHNETGVDQSLQPGREPSRLSLTLLSLSHGCRLTQELKTLWSWHDGDTGSEPFIWYHDFLPLNRAILEYQWLIVNPLVRWDPDYIPIASFQGEWFGAYCGSNSEVAGPILHYFLEDEPRITAINLTTFIATMAEVLESGAVQWENGGMVEDIAKVATIHQAKNPGYAFPYAISTGD